MSRRVTRADLNALKAAGQKIAVLTAYDFPTARLLDGAGVDVLLVGDSLGMVVQGRETTLPVTLEQMLYHAEMVARAAERAFVVCDLPFPPQPAAATLADAASVLKQTRCQAVKLEGGVDQAEVIEHLVRSGVPVMGHIGLQPQSVHAVGGYKVQRDADRLLEDARAVAAAGAFAVVLECIEAKIAARITDALEIPTIGIGAGAGCDGQVLVLHDLLGLTAGRVPKFVKRYAELGEVITKAVHAYCEDVRGGAFPGNEHAY